jgi:phage repressor protein C with HTH and peptisase S24 domain
MSKPASTFTHDWIWGAIDTLASRQGLSPSALARLAGLDPTTFNRSKRFTPEGRPRWPSTESIAKVLEATGTPLDEFASLELANVEAGPEFIEAEPEQGASVPLIGEVRDAVVDGLADAPRLHLGQGRRKAAAGRPGARFALAVADASLEPVYSQGNTLIVATNAVTRTGDRVVVRTVQGQALPRLLLRATRTRIELTAFQPGRDRIELPRSDVDWIGRIMWARQ